MKTCLICGELCSTDATTCPKCGEASWLTFEKVSLTIEDGESADPVPLSAYIDGRKVEQVENIELGGLTVAPKKAKR